MHSRWTCLHLHDQRTCTSREKHPYILHIKVLTANLLLRQNTQARAEVNPCGFFPLRGGGFTVAKLFPMSSFDVGFHTRRPRQGRWAPRGRAGCIDNIGATEMKFSRLQKHELPFGFNDSSLSKSTGTSRQPEMLFSGKFLCKMNKVWCSACSLPCSLL